MGLKAGKLDRRISVERASVVSVNDYGAESLSTAVVHSCWAQLVTRNTQDALTGEAEAVAFRIRLTSGLKTSDRVTFDGRAYEIREISPLDRGGVLELRCVRVGGVA